MFVRVNGQRLFFDTVGAQLEADGERMRERPCLLVLHGGPGFDHTGLRPFFDRFADIVQVVYLDHRGNGRSVPSSPDSWTLAQWGDDVAGFCDTLGISRPIVLGQSFGGMVAQSYAIRHPGHAAGLILSSTAARMDLDASIAWFGDKGGPLVCDTAHRFWTIGDDAAFADYLRVCMPLYNTTMPVPGQETRARAIVRPEVFRHFSLPGREIRSMDFRADLGRIGCPVLVIAGEADPITPPRLSQEIAEALQPGIGRLVTFSECGHGPFRDNPQGVDDVIRRFLSAFSDSEDA
jgi:proline iminopeptidase